MKRLSPLLLLFLLTNTSFANKLKEIKASNDAFYYTGRYVTQADESIRFGWAGFQINFGFTGKKLLLLMGNQSLSDTEESNYYNVIIDDQKPKVVKVTNEYEKVDLSKELRSGKHTVQIFKRTEALVGNGIFYGIEIGEGNDVFSNIPDSDFKIEFIGNSLTSGYGNEGANGNCKFSDETENAYLSYASIAARALNAEYQLISFSGKGLVENYGHDTHETMPILYNRILPHTEKLVYNFKMWKPDLVCINLGTNDFSMSNPDRELFVSSYVSFIKRIRVSYPNAKILILSGIGMSDYWPEGTKARTTSESYFDEIKQWCEKLGITDVYRKTLTVQGQFGYGCDWHPNVKQHQFSADELIPFIRAECLIK